MTVFTLGDVVRFDRGSITHVALYIGNGQVIHTWSPMHGGVIKVRIDSIALIMESHEHGSLQASQPYRCTHELDAAMGQKWAATPFKSEEVVRRARTRLGNSRYNLLTNNCEHFVTWARYGIATSSQAKSYSVRITGGMLLTMTVCLCVVENQLVHTELNQSDSVDDYDKLGWNSVLLLPALE